jgi:hypothetical protein
VHVTLLALQHKQSKDPPHPQSGVKGDSWFGSVKACLALNRHGVEGVFQIKTCYRLYPKVFIKDTLKGVPGGVHIVLEGRNRHTEEKLIAVGYRYSIRKTLCSIMSTGATLTRKGVLYEIEFPY